MKTDAERECSELSFDQQNLSVRVKFESNVVFTLFWYSFVLNQGNNFYVLFVKKFLNFSFVILKVSYYLGCLVLGCL